jgi:hypothetical protein
MPGSAISTWHSPTRPTSARDQRLAWLLDDLWRAHFADVPRPNAVMVGFGFPWKWRLGRIRMSLDGSTSEITLNGLLDRPEVPRSIYIAIMAHEIVHYAQGFASPLPRAQRHAHAHGAVGYELARRGLGDTEALLQRWGAECWPAVRALALAERQRRGVHTPVVLATCTASGNMV